MAHGGKRPGTGRPAGSKNKRSQEIQDRLDDLGVDPIEGMAMIAADPNSTPELKLQCYKELAQYVAPKRKAVDMNTVHSGEMTIEVVNFNELDENQGT
jgi:hypothetical protein|tara:strand:- start:18351 stop:18644 length:294 start_codon:yes stop_codon:yes gene_type:complete